MKAEAQVITADVVNPNGFICPAELLRDMADTDPSLRFDEDRQALMKTIDLTGVISPLRAQIQGRITECHKTEDGSIVIDKIEPTGAVVIENEPAVRGTLPPDYDGIEDIEFNFIGIPGEIQRDLREKKYGRCEVTNNICGTDTWPEGQPCTCLVCQRWLNRKENTEPYRLADGVPPAYRGK